MSTSFAKIKPFSLSVRHLAALATIFLLTACATNTRPEVLRTPAQVTCIDLQERITFGFPKIPDYTRFEKGPYIAEKEDDAGTYYRAPAGAMSTIVQAFPDEPYKIWDGGFWIPRDPELPLRKYFYFTSLEYSTIGPRAPATPIDNGSCATAAYVRDPAKGSVSLVIEFVDAGAVGGVIGRARYHGGGISYGQAAAGGVIGGLIVGALISNEIGTIQFSQDKVDPASAAKLRALASQAKPLKEVSTLNVQPFADGNASQ